MQRSNEESVQILQTQAASQRSLEEPAVASNVRPLSLTVDRPPCTSRSVRKTLARAVLVVVGLALSGCVADHEPSDPGEYPYGLEAVETSPSFQPVDLDGDGRDERVRITSLTEAHHDGDRRGVHLATLDRRVLRQVNFDGTVLNVRAIDLQDDGTREVVVPVTRNDSLFYHVLGADGTRKYHFFVASGSPRTLDDGTLAWDPRTPYLRRVDVTDDPGKELVSVLRTGYARQPRGVWIHTLPEGERVGRLAIGAMPKGAFVDDVDRDATPELLFGSHATENGATGAGLDDAYSYVAAIELSTNPHVEWSRQMGGAYTRAHLTRGDLDGDGTWEYVAFREFFGGRQEVSPLHLIDPATGGTKLRREPDAPLVRAQVADLDADPEAEIVTHHTDGTVRVLEAQLEEMRRRSISGLQGISLLPDLNGNGHADIRAVTDRGTRLLDGQLDTWAVTDRDLKGRVVRRGLGETPYVQAPATKATDVDLLRITPQPMWWARRYGPWAGLGLGILAAVVLVRSGAGWLRRHRVQAAALDRLLDTGDRAGLIVHPTLGVVQAPPGALKQLGLDEAGPRAATNGAVPSGASTSSQTVNRRVSAGFRGGDPPAWRSGRADEGATAGVSMETLQEHVPDLAEAVRAASEQTVDLGPDRPRATVTPLPVVHREHAYRLVRLIPARSSRYEAWGRLAQRVAHDLKNPLTSILLTLQRMQMEYRTQDPTGELAHELDDYTTRIEDRISTLRRMTTNVLKFVGEEEPRRTATDLSAFVTEQSQRLRDNLPPDIELRHRLDDVPAVAVDQEQMQSVLENLVTNAVDAMPDGGTITVSTHLEDDLYVGTDEPGDYVGVEVMDTGTGMTDDEREGVFDAGYSTTGGTGLGLAIVRKIVRDHGGHVTLETEPDVGTVVGLYLPVSEDDAA